VDFLLSQNNFIILIIAIVSGAMLLFPSLTRGRGGQALSPTEAVQLINRNNARLIDIRSPERFAAQHITQARNIPADQLIPQTERWAKDTPLILVCDTGRSTTGPATQLRKQGFSSVYTLTGGLNAWVQAGLPTKTQPAQQAKLAKGK